MLIAAVGLHLAEQPATGQPSQVSPHLMHSTDASGGTAAQGPVERITFKDLADKGGHNLL